MGGKSAMLLSCMFAGVITGISIPDAACNPSSPRIPEHTISMANFGIGDGRTRNTAVVGQAIKRLAEQGGGKLVVPPYPYTLDPAASVPAIVQAGAGPR